MKHLRVTAAALAMLAGLQAHSEVQFMGWTQSEDTGKAAMAALAETFDGEVDLQGYAWGEINKNYILRSRSNTLPDVGQVQGRLLPTVAAGASPIDLNDVIGRDKLLDMFDPGFLAMGEVNGMQVGVPWITGTIGWVANKEVMDMAGVESVPSTIGEFKEALEAVKAADPDSVPFGMATKNPNSILLDYLILAWTFGADPISADGQAQVNTPEGIAALDFMVEMVQGGLAAPEIDRPDARRLFAQGNTAFYIDAPQARSFARNFSGRGEEIDAAVLPIAGPIANAGDTPVSIQWGHILTVFGDDNRSIDSDGIRWIMHLLADEQLVDYAVGQSVLPATRSGQASDSVQSDSYLANWASASQSPRRNTVASLSNASEVAAIIGEEIQAAILGMKSSSEAAQDMQARLDDIL